MNRLALLLVLAISPAYSDSLVDMSGKQYDPTNRCSNDWQLEDDLPVGKLVSNSASFRLSIETSIDSASPFNGEVSLIPSTIANSNKSFSMMNVSYETDKKTINTKYRLGSEVTFGKPIIKGNIYKVCAYINNEFLSGEYKHAYKNISLPRIKKRYFIGEIDLYLDKSTYLKLDDDVLVTLNAAIK
jgi:hypothetical protein